MVDTRNWLLNKRITYLHTKGPILYLYFVYVATWIGHFSDQDLIFTEFSIRAKKLVFTNILNLYIPAKVGDIGSQLRRTGILDK